MTDGKPDARAGAAATPLANRTHACMDRDTSGEGAAVQKPLDGWLGERGPGQPSWRVRSTNAATGYWDLIEEDDARLTSFGSSTLRERLGWGAWSVDPRALNAWLGMHASPSDRACRVSWTLHHCGVPRGVNIFDEDFAARFAGFCKCVARCVLPFAEGPSIFSQSSRFLGPWTRGEPVRSYAQPYGISHLRRRSPPG
ncbi:MAG: hypothetical protein EOP82_06560 [Variovorax sp.]|nr:MAG: hypothetical protein EOP82_06560 [Variovorax sp.]